MFGGMAPGKGEKMQADYKNKGLNLLKKGQKGIVHAIFSRFGLVLNIQACASALEQVPYQTSAGN